MTHYYFDLIDGVSKRDRRGLECVDDAAALLCANTIANEVSAAGGENSRPDLHISIVHEDGHEVSRMIPDNGTNLPQMGGLEALARIKGEPSLRAIPIIILTTSDNEGDVLGCYKLGAACYLQKPAQWDAFDALIHTIDMFWFTKAKLPLLPE
jgi:DNA-binding NarL/FixJ family response regulator